MHSSGGSDLTSLISHSPMQRAADIPKDKKQILCCQGMQQGIPLHLKYICLSLKVPKASWLLGCHRSA